VLGTAADLHVERARTGEVNVPLPAPSTTSATLIVELTYNGSVMDLPPRTL
jgi:hypothetical protein